MEDPCCTCVAYLHQNSEVKLTVQRAPEARVYNWSQRSIEEVRKVPDQAENTGMSHAD
jgi:hypothetical protein